ncbi:hypothetical protein [Rhizomonospora bruguierae]|uniref:hypothetical protein n=1 Tax=Rhizomonospora bruguierae TaxID=1581705 RepID=UPI001BCE0D58|nr:hypothetical protein [Micromonospora sp. NBRC 107566]
MRRTVNLVIFVTVIGLVVVVAANIRLVWREVLTLLVLDLLVASPLVIRELRRGGGDHQ